MYTSKKQMNTHERGFTIMETLIAILILTLSITGPLAFSQSGLRTSFTARDQMIAFYLAQDAIESIKNYRDQRIIDDLVADDEWLGDLPGTCTTNLCSAWNDESAFDINTTEGDITDSIANCGSADCFMVKDSNKHYIPTGGTGEETPFARKIYLREVEYGREAQIIVEVTWRTTTTETGLRSLVVQENMYNWIPK